MSSFFPRLSEYIHHFTLDFSEKSGGNSIPQFSDMVSSDDSVRYRRKLAKLSRHHVVEICLSDIESIRNAIQGGANSIEICSDRSQGGITPSIGLVRQAVKLCRNTGVEVNVLVRPRAGYFTYSHDEFDVILRDIIAFEKAGVTGVVVGILTKEGHVDIEKMRIVKQISKDMKLTFHRAFDVCTQSISESIKALLSVPCDRLLTSGKKPTAIQGKSNLDEIIRLSHGRLEIIAASGIGADNVYELVTCTQVLGVHAGSSVTSKIHNSYANLPSAPNYQSMKSERSGSFDGSDQMGNEASMYSGTQGMDMSWIDVHSVAQSQTTCSTDHNGIWDVVDVDLVADLLEHLDRGWKVAKLRNGSVADDSTDSLFNSMRPDGIEPAPIHRSDESQFNTEEKESPLRGIDSNPSLNGDSMKIDDGISI